MLKKINNPLSKLSQIFWALLMCFSTYVEAAYPDKPIRFISSTAAGGPLDTMARTMAKMLSDELKQPVIVENKPGGTGILAMNYALNQAADGYTIVTATGSTSFMLAEGNASFTENDFIFISGLQSEPTALAVVKSSPIKNLEDFLQFVKNEPEKVNIAGYGNAGFNQLVYSKFQQQANFKGAWVPYTSAGQVVLSLLGGQVPAAVITPSSAISQIQNGDIRLLALSTAKRDLYFPKVPTFKEKGFNIVESLWRGIMVKKGTSNEVLTKLTTAIANVEKTPEWRRFMAENAQSSMNLSVDQMQEFVKNEIATRKAFLNQLK